MSPLIPVFNVKLVHKHAINRVFGVQRVIRETDVGQAILRVSQTKLLPFFGIGAGGAWYPKYLRDFRNLDSFSFDFTK